MPHLVVASLAYFPTNRVCLVGTRREDHQDARDFKGDWLPLGVQAPLYELSYRDVWDLLDHLEVQVSPVYARGCTHGVTPTVEGHARDSKFEMR